MSHTIKILEIKNLTHDVKQITTEKPEGYSFSPGQATEVSINKEGFRDQKRPFTFTSLPSDNELEFTIKIYPDHNGVTDEIDSLVVGDELIIDESWGAIEYKGKGSFIAGGAGITPFIAILRDLKQKSKLDGNHLLFSNKKEEDVIMQAEFKKMLGKNFVSTLTREDVDGHTHGKIDSDFLRDHISNFDQYFYICGPDKMVNDIKVQLKELGVSEESMIFEE